MLRALVVIVLVVGAAGHARAQGFFSSPPGPLSPSHHTIDGPSHCNDCHVNGTKDVSDKLCLGCHDHENLAAKINAGQGFHASSVVRSRECKTCHHEHLPKVNIMGWSSVGGEASFNHDLTKWPLKGKHASTKCADCHKKTSSVGEKLYVGTDPTCGGCHAKDQPHGFVRKDMLACDRCHGESAWKAIDKAKMAARFDHDSRKDTAMPLLGSHKGVACTKCHPKNLFDLPAAVPTNCGNSGCHRSTHDGHLFGTKPCDRCHSPMRGTFKQPTQAQLVDFDHKGETRFELGGKHATIKCKDCHTDERGESKPGLPCEQCHAKDSHHRDRFKAFGTPPRCATCHPMTSWTPSNFNHSSTRMPLAAKHAQIACRKCHGGGPVDWLNFTADPSCKGCHQHEKVHADPKHPKGRWASAQCLKCHPRPGDKGLRAPKELEQEFHGPRSDFPLVKKHKGKDCVLCHKSATTGRVSFDDAESPECGDRCHEDSLHLGTLGKRCTACHTGGSFSAEIFDHDKPFPKETQGLVRAYPLVGEHRKLTCEKCHPTKKYAETNVRCSDEGCHARDDAHKGRLGKECERCHLETGDVIFNHNKQSDFHLDGKHLQVRCTDCHASKTFKPRPKTCFGCHPEPRVHKGQYGTTCEQCHTTRTWGDVKPLHDVGDFALRGMHGNIACERCHRDNRPLAGSGNLCINCHRNDDIHNNSLSPRCGECHTQWSFSPARFDHTRVGCNLTGLHRTLSCAGCHRNGNFAGLSPNCVGCHHDDAVRVNGISTGTMTPHAQELTCAGCHNPNAWNPKIPSGRESVCR